MRFLKNPKQRIVLYALIGVLSWYIGSYAVRSVYGAWHLSQSGAERPFGGLAISDIIEWRPQGCWFQRRFWNVRGETQTRGNRVGYFYAPLIMLDRWLIHPTRNLDEMPDEGKDLSA